LERALVPTAVSNENAVMWFPASPTCAKEVIEKEQHLAVRCLGRRRSEVTVDYDDERMWRGV
jgi:hypothetical protein